MVTASCAEVKSSSFVHMAIKDIGMEVAIKQLMTASEELIKVSRCRDVVFIDFLSFLIAAKIICLKDKF